MCAYYAGIDIGGTNIKAALTDESLNPICMGSLTTAPTPPDRAPELVLGRAARMIREMMGQHGISDTDLRAIGLGMAGIVDSANAELLQFNALGWRHLHPLEILKKDFQAPIFLENDGTVNLIGESQAGAARNVRDVILITLGTGVGGAIMVNGKILGGALGLGGEIGHIYIDGGKTFQQYCSATSVVQSACSLLEQYPNSLLWETCGHTPSSVTTKMIAACAERQDPLCLTVMEETSLHLSYALTSFINVFNPSLILIGGGMSQAGDLLLAPAIKRTMKSIHHPKLACEIRSSALGGMAGALGACALASLRFSKGGY